MEPISSVPLHVWSVNGFEVKLIESEDSLEYETVNAKDLQPICKNSFDLQNNTKEQIVSYLKKCHVMIEPDGHANFFYNFCSWNLENKEIHLLNKGNNHLIWEVFCKSVEITTFFSIGDATVASTRCHPATVAIINKMKNGLFTPTELSQFLNDFKIVRIVESESYAQELKELLRLKESMEQHELERYIENKVLQPHVGLATAASTVFSIYRLCTMPASLFAGAEFLGSLAPLMAKFGIFYAAGVTPFLPIIAATSYCFWRYHTDAENRLTEQTFASSSLTFKCFPLSIELEPKLTASSVMDDRILVSKFTWAVTLTKGPSGSRKSHTAIVVEGLANAYFKNEIEDGQYFLHQSEYNPPIKSRICSVEKLKKRILGGGVERSETWMIPSEKVEAMFRLIEREQAFVDEEMAKGTIKDINMPGIASWAGDGTHSCITWAKKMLKTLGVKVIKTSLGSPKKIFTVPGDYTETFEEHSKRPFVAQI